MRNLLLINLSAVAVIIFSANGNYTEASPIKREIFNLTITESANGGFVANIAGSSTYYTFAEKTDLDTWLTTELATFRTKVNTTFEQP